MQFLDFVNWICLSIVQINKNKVWVEGDVPEVIRGII